MPASQHQDLAPRWTIPRRAWWLTVLLPLRLSCNLPSSAGGGVNKTTNSPPPPLKVQPSAASTPTASVYVPPSCQGTSIATIPAATNVAEATPSLDANPELTTVRQLKVFDEITSTITQKYL